jgi:hypothetical protein
LTDVEREWLNPARVDPAWHGQRFDEETLVRDDRDWRPGGWRRSVVVLSVVERS